MSGETINFEALIQSAKDQKAQNVNITKLDSLLNYQILSPFEIKFVNSVKEKLEKKIDLSEKQTSTLPSLRFSSSATRLRKSKGVCLKNTHFYFFYPLLIFHKHSLLKTVLKNHLVI